ncbi:hypothetical protein A2U01_0090169, partial [Trifolium medium]|nr:hypothetical protein [Trifolium medium]
VVCAARNMCCFSACSSDGCATRRGSLRGAQAFKVKVDLS